MIKAQGFSIPMSVEEALHPDRCALIVYDMQIGILGQLKHGPEVLASVQEVIATARGASMRIIYMRHMSLPKAIAGAFQLRQAMAWQRVASPEEVHPWFLRDSPGFQLSPDIEVTEDDAIFDKIGMSAFEGTPLATALRDCGVISFAICGVATEIGIDPTVRQGADLGFIPIVITDACGHGHRESADRALENMRHMGDAYLTDRGQFASALASVAKDGS